MTWALVLVAGIATALVMSVLAEALVEMMSEAADEAQGDWPRLPDDFPPHGGEGSSL